MKLHQLFEQANLDEVKKWVTDHWHYDKTDLTALFASMKIENGLVIFGDGEFLSFENVNGELPFPFGGDVKIFEVTGSHLKSFKNFPKKCGSLRLTLTTFDRLEGFPEEISNINLMYSGGQTLTGDASKDHKHTFSSFKGINKHLKKFVPRQGFAETGNVGGTNWCYTGLLGFLLIPGFTEFSNMAARKGIKEAIEIMNKYAGKGKAGMLKAQRELLDANLDDFEEFDL